jgi:hypothetical protein
MSSNRKLTADDIGTMSNDELESRFQSLVSYIERERRKGKNHLELEIEACYFRREMQNRAVVRENHQIWLQKNHQNVAGEVSFS